MYLIILKTITVNYYQKNIKIKTKLTYICKCGNESVITFSNFKDKNVRCRKCSGCEKYTYEQVFDIFKNRNCILISNNYKDAFGKLAFRALRIG